MPVPIAVVDAFTDTAFHGNPAAVCRLERPADDAWMQAVAAEMNLAETAFVVPRADDSYDLRWLTPVSEVDLCGHATLATAHLLGGDARFHTRSGVLSCRRRDDGIIEMDFPALTPTVIDPPAGLAGALRTDRIVAVASSRFDLLVELASAAEVRALHPDVRAVAELPVRGVVVTAAGDREGVDCVSRFFGPAVGVDEDPVTGSAHCVLAPYWAAPLGRTHLVGEQASTRGGIVHMTLDGDRVRLGGRAVTVWEGQLLADRHHASASR